MLRNLRSVLKQVLGCGQLHLGVCIFDGIFMLVIQRLEVSPGAMECVYFEYLFYIGYYRDCNLKICMYIKIIIYKGWYIEFCNVCVNIYILVFDYKINLK